MLRQRQELLAKDRARQAYLEERDLILANLEGVSREIQQSVREMELEYLERERRIEADLQRQRERLMIKRG